MTDIALQELLLPNERVLTYWILDRLRESTTKKAQQLCSFSNSAWQTSLVIMPLLIPLPYSCHQIEIQFIPTLYPRSLEPEVISRQAAVQDRYKLHQSL